MFPSACLLPFVVQSLGAQTCWVSPRGQALPFAAPHCYHAYSLWVSRPLICLLSLLPVRRAGHFVRVALVSVRQVALGLSVLSVASTEGPRTAVTSECGCPAPSLLVGGVLPMEPSWLPAVCPSSWRPTGRRTVGTPSVEAKPLAERCRRLMSKRQSGVPRRQRAPAAPGTPIRSGGRGQRLRGSRGSPLLQQPEGRGQRGCNCNLPPAVSALKATAQVPGGVSPGLAGTHTGARRQSPPPHAVTHLARSYGPTWKQRER